MLPYHGQFLTPIQVAVSVSQGKLKPIIPQGIHPGLTMLLDMCFLLDAAQRPTFVELVLQLSAVIEDVKNDVSVVNLIVFPLFPDYCSVID